LLARAMSRGGIASRAASWRAADIASFRLFAAGFSYGVDRDDSSIAHAAGAGAVSYRVCSAIGGRLGCDEGSV
jgi:hypothetical protein